MDKIKELVAVITAETNTINEEIAKADAKGYVYGRAKEIRKSAQTIAVAIKSLRKAATDAVPKKVK